jgi:hypothetical protein
VLGDALVVEVELLLERVERVERQRALGRHHEQVHFFAQAVHQPVLGLEAVPAQRTQQERCGHTGSTGMHVGLPAVGLETWLGAVQAKHLGEIERERERDNTERRIH